jgi:hypothetical protein
MKKLNTEMPSPPAHGSARSYAQQIRQCILDGNYQRMTARNYSKLSGEDQQQAEAIRKFWKANNHAGLGFCGMKPGICSRSHCKRIGNLKT